MFLAQADNDHTPEIIGVLVGLVFCAIVIGGCYTLSRRARARRLAASGATERGPEAKIKRRQSTGRVFLGFGAAITVIGFVWRQIESPPSADAAFANNLIRLVCFAIGGAAIIIGIILAKGRAKQ